MIDELHEFVDLKQPQVLVAGRRVRRRRWVGSSGGIVVGEGLQAIEERCLAEQGTLGHLDDVGERPRAVVCGSEKAHRPARARRGTSRGASPTAVADHVGMADWKRWHVAYDDPASGLSGRLAVVRNQLSHALDRAAVGPVRLLSLCAGEGRDVLPVLARHSRGGDVTGCLVEFDSDLVATARRGAPPGIEVVQADAGMTGSYVGAVPADVLLLCGIFGNIEDQDVERTVRAVPCLLAEGGTVMWTRHRRAPDLTPSIRAWFAEAGVREVAFESEDGDRGWAVGAGVLRVSARPLESRRLFTFTRRDV